MGGSAPGRARLGARSAYSVGLGIFFRGGAFGV